MMDEVTEKGLDNLREYAESVAHYAYRQGVREGVRTGEYQVASMTTLRLQSLLETIQDHMDGVTTQDPEYDRACDMLEELKAITRGENL